MAEFAPAFVVLILFVVIPMIDLGIIPIRYGLAYQVINDQIRKLSLANKVSDANRMLVKDTSWRTFLANAGVNVKKVSLALVVTDKSNTPQLFSTGQPKPVPDDSLPDGKNCPCTYQLELRADADISPLLTASEGGIPGLTAPWPASIYARSAWENFGRDPETEEYYLNE